MERIVSGDEITYVVWNRDDAGGRRGRLVDVHLRCFDWNMLDYHRIVEVYEFPGELYDLGLLKIRKYRDYNKGKYDAYGQRKEKPMIRELFFNYDSTVVGEADIW